MDSEENKDSAGNEAESRNIRLQPFQPNKYVLRIRTRPQRPSVITEEASSSSSEENKLKNRQNRTSIKLPELKAQCSTDSSDMSSSQNNITNSTSTSASRMENGDKIPRLVPGVYHKMPTPILSEHEKSILSNNNDVDSKSLKQPPGISSGMRGPPPAWLPPCPPDKDHDYENNYEDPENLQKNKDMSRELLLNNSCPPPMYNSYELSLSQQRRSKASTANISTAPSNEDWHSDDGNQRVLHKNSEGTYYIPSVAVSEHTTTSTLSPSSQIRYQEQCAGMLTTGRGTLTSSKGDPATATLIKYNTTASLSRPVANKKRSPIMHEYLEKRDKDSASIWKPSICMAALLVALIISLIIIVLLLLRSPHYVYSELSPVASRAQADPMAVDESILRPLPAIIGVGERIEADIPPKHTVITEMFISRPIRILFNITLGAGAQMVLLGRHSVPPTLYIHDFFRPLKAQLSTAPKNSLRQKRMTQTPDITDPRSAIVEEFLLEGRWHLMIINERNRVEPFILSISAINPPSSSNEMPSSLSRPAFGRTQQTCEMNCSGHGECIEGKCKCVKGYTGDICEDAVCPLVCSGNGVFSGGVCVCNAGFKGKECDIRFNWCEKPDCSGNGKCSANGKCHCNRGWIGEFCEERNCIPLCSNGGICVKGTCYCTDGWTGSDCGRPAIMAPSRHDTPALRQDSRVVASTPSRSVENRKHNTAPVSTSKPVTSKVTPATSSYTTTASPCSTHGKYDGHKCVCNEGWTGHICSERTCTDCINGRCENGECMCITGFMGTACDQKACAIGCEDHGECFGNGTCICQKGWNGGNCFIDGCPRSCSGYGECAFSPISHEWSCQCQPGRTGADCAVSIELDCHDGLDNDGDALIDCDDPECCNADACRNQGACVFSANPSEVLLRLPGKKNVPFSQRIAFIYQNEIQKYADPAKFNESLVSIVRGRVTWNAGATTSSVGVNFPLPGVRVSDGRTPLWGFTLSRLDGEFDLVVNGGQTIQLRFQRNPFSKVISNVYVPPNEIFHVGDVHMYTEKAPAPRPTRRRSQCEKLNQASAHNPIVRTSRDFGTDGATRSGLLVDTRSFVKIVELPGSSARLVYDSSRVLSAQSWIVIGLLSEQVDEDLRIIHIEVNLAGKRFETKLAPSPNLTYSWSWDKQNVYKQSEHGLTNAHIRIGYEYKDCDRTNEIIWYWRTVEAEGATARSMEGNAWTIDIHHHLDTINNVIEMGDGGKRFLKNGIRMLETIVGKAAKKSVSCTNCTTVSADEATLLRPSDIVVTKDGSFYVADHDVIRFVSHSTGLVRTVLQLSAADTSHSYQLAVNPVDDALYVSLSFTKQIWKVLSNEPQDISNNHLVVAGDGTACTSHDSACGDGGFAVDSQLITPKGIAFDAQGNLYIADGRKIRLVDTTNVIKSIVDSSASVRPSCSQSYFSISSLQLEWPTSLSVQQSTGRLFVLDSNTVYELEYQSGTARVAVGSIPTCTNNSSFAISFVKDIAIMDTGSLYILESDGKQVNQVRLLSQDGTSLKLIAGGRSACGCDMPSCECDDSVTTLPANQARLNSPMAIAMTARSELLIVDSGNGKIKKVSRSSANYDAQKRIYTVVDANRQEVYAFNRYGLHSWTQSLVTGKVVYNFTYNVDTSLGTLSSIHGAGELLLRIIRRNETHVTIETPSGQRTILIHSLYDGTIDTIQRSENGPMRLRYQPGGCLLTQIQDHFSMTISYDRMGRVRSVRQDGEGFDMVSEKIIDGRYMAEVYRNGEQFATLTMDQEEFIYEDSARTRLNSLDDGFLISSNNMVTLLDTYSHPEHGQPTIMKSKISIPSVQNPSRRELTYRFDWRPFIKRNSEKRVAEVGIRPRVNGINIYSVAFDRESHSDVIRARSNDAVLLTVGYTDSGEINSIVLPNYENSEAVKSDARNLTVVYDSLSRRSEVVWGNMSIQAAYDRQNRVVEYIRMKTSPIRFGYHKDYRHPVSVEMPDSLKYSMKLDSRGRLKEVTTPMGDVHSFNSIPIGREKILLRRYPFTKKPFRLALDENNNVCEFASADDMHHYVSSKNIYGQTESVLCDSVLTTFSRDRSSMIKLIVSPNLHVNYSWQGPLISSISYSNLQEKRFSVSTFSYEYDDMFRPTSVHCTIEGVAVESIRIGYDDRSSLLNEVQGYQINRNSARRQITGQNMVHDVSYDSYMRKENSRVSVGDNQISHVISRDITGRVVANDWHGPFGTKRESYEYDKLGRVVALTTSGKRHLLLFNNDGRPHSSNDITFEWHSGGVPKRNNRTEYSVDGNGWVIKRGNIMFEYDCVGRLSGSLLPNGLRFQFSYDHEERLSTIRKGASTRTLFYALPDQKNRVTHFSNQDSSVGSILYDEKGIPFVLNQNGYRYALLTDSFGSLRYVISDSSIVKEIYHDIYGSVLTDTDSEFFVPIGYRGGIDIPELSVTIINGRPLDTQLGRFLSFGPKQAIQIDFSAMESTMDLFSFKYSDQTDFPLDISSWFEHVGLSPRLLPPLPLHMNLAGVISSRRLASFPTVFKRFSTPTSLSPSALVDTTSSGMLPPNDVKFTSDNSGFFNLFLLVPDVNTTILEPLPSLSADDEALLRLLFNESVELDWRQWNSGFERHFVRPHLAHTLTSESRSHFTIIVSQEQVELRAEKDKIIVHFGKQADVQKSLVEDLKKKERPALWRAQQRKIERRDNAAANWTEEQKKQILSRGSVDGYQLEYMNYLNVRFPTIHSWRIVPSN